MPLVATSRIVGRIRSSQSGRAGGVATFISASWTSAGTRASVGRGSLVASQREIVEDRAVRAIVAMAGGGQVPKRGRHRLQFGDPRDLPARAAAIAQQSQELADFRN